MRVEKASRAPRARSCTTVPPPAPARRFAAALAAGAPPVRPRRRQNSPNSRRSVAKSVAIAGSAPRHRSICRRHRRPPRRSVDIASHGMESCACWVIAFGRRSITRFALPCERSIVPGATTRTVRRHTDIGLDQMLGPAARASARSSDRRAADSGRVSTRTSSSSSAPSRASPPARSAARAAPRAASTASIWVGNTLTPRMISMSSLRPLIALDAAAWSAPCPGSSRVRSRVR